MGTGKAQRASGLSWIKALPSRAEGRGRQRMFRQIFAPGNILITLPTLGKHPTAHAQSLTFLTIQRATPNGFKALSALRRVTKHNNGHFLFSRCDLQPLCAQLCVFRLGAVDFSEKTSLLLPCRSLPGCPFCWVMLQNCSPIPSVLGQGRWRVPLAGRFALEGVGMCGAGQHKARGLVV